MQPSEQTEHPIDYLDSISTVPRGVKKGPPDLIFFGAIIAVLLASLLLGAFVIFGRGDTTKDNWSTLSVKLVNLDKIADASQKNIASSELRATNTRLTLALTNATHDIDPFLTAHEVDSAKPDPKVTAKENTDELEATLEDARLNAIFNRTYAREMSYQLDTALILLKQLESKTKNKDQQKFLTTTYSDLLPLQERFANFDPSTS